MEREYRCQGKDRSYRTFEKLINDAKNYEIMDSEREKQMEEVIIKQAPRSL
jgi:hypothetical protein